MTAPGTEAWEAPASWEEVDSLVLWDRNPRKNQPVEPVAASIERFGFGAPVVARRADRVVIAGHTRIKAVRWLIDQVEGWDADRRLALMERITAPSSSPAVLREALRLVPVRFLDVTEAEAHALALGDNKLGELADWDDPQLGSILTELSEVEVDSGLLGWTDRESDRLRQLVLPLVPEPAEAPEPAPGPPDSQPGRVYRLGRHVLVCGDGTSEPLWAEHVGEAHLVFTSPPYGAGVDYDGYEDSIENLRALLAVLPGLWARHVVPGGFAVVNFSDKLSGQEIAGTDEPCEYPMAIDYWPAFRSAGWLLWARRVWCKPHARTNGPWTFETNRAAIDWEHVWTWKRPGPAIVGRQNRSALGRIEPNHTDEVEPKAVHGAAMPVYVAKQSIETHTEPGMLVVDPFGGTGTTLIAAELTGRRCVTFEQSPIYCDLIRRRWDRQCRASGADPGPDSLNL